jgi:hypothetical protein
VKWRMVCKPKDLGGLGIHDLSHFGRALRERWFWYHCTDDLKPWHGMTLSCDDQDKAPFQASTEIKLGDGKKAIFWHDKWPEGKASKEIAPNLYNLAHFKRRSVAKELEDNNWIYVAHHISTREELREYIKLWDLLRNVNLNDTQKDLIIWKWTADGSYSSTSAYNMQFQGSYSLFRVGKLWKAKVEPKVKFFGWTAMHQTIMTANNLAARVMQHSNACPLCQQAPEDARHLLINRSSRELLHLMSLWFAMEGSPSTCSQDQCSAAWLGSNTQIANPANCKEATRVLLYHWWNVWKERNKRVPS